MDAKDSSSWPLGWLIAGLLCLHSSAADRGPVPGLNSGTPFLLYYGNWDASKVDFARNHYRLVVLHPQSNITAADIATIRRGPDGVSGTADDVLVFGYLSIAEDARPGAPFVGNGLGPRIDPRSSDDIPLSAITNSLGLPSPGGTNFASYYLDTRSNPDGLPDQNPFYHGFYVNAGDPTWWDILKKMTLRAGGSSGLDELLTPVKGAGFDCDGVFLDTLDTAAPNNFGGTTYEWTAPGVQALLQWISTNYPSKLIFANRGLFFYNPNLKHFAYNLRPYVNLVLFESYCTDSGNSGQVSPFFPDNKYQWAPKLNAEASRPDGFNVFAFGYGLAPGMPAPIIAEDYFESMAIQGWPLYRSNPNLDSPFSIEAAGWISNYPDTESPVWDSTAADSALPPPARVGLQSVLAGDKSATLFWDVAHDQTGPVRYNVYFTSEKTLNFATATRLSHVTPQLPSTYAQGAGPGRYPFEYTITGLSNGVSYLFAVRAEDSANPPHEDTNIITLANTPHAPMPVGTFRFISIDGVMDDWISAPIRDTAASANSVIDFATVSVANDEDFLYLHFTLYSPAIPFADYNTHIFIDADNNAQTGYHVPGTSIGSELVIETGAGYAESATAFNDGTISGVSWAMSPVGVRTNFEARISRQARYANGSLVFTNAEIRIVLQDNRSSLLSPTGTPYTFVSPGAYESWLTNWFARAELLVPAISGDAADPDGDGLPNLIEFAFNLDPKTPDESKWPRAFVQQDNGAFYFYVQFPQRLPPAGVEYLLQTSPDLSTWQTINSSQVSAVQRSDGLSLVTLRYETPLSLDSSKMFVRLAVLR